MSLHFDAIIIGTGQAGPSLAARLVASGMSVAIIERNKVGGTCVARSNRGMEQSLRGLKNCTVVEGHASFQSARTVEVNDVLQADRIFINVGGRASVPPIQSSLRCRSADTSWTSG